MDGWMETNLYSEKKPIHKHTMLEISSYSLGRKIHAVRPTCSFEVTTCDLIG